MLRSKIGYFIFCVVILFISIVNCDEDLVKFFLYGQSNTYAVHLVRHNPIIVLVLGGLSISFIIFLLFNKKSIIRYSAGIFLILWGISLRTYGIIVDDPDTVIVSGISFIPTGKCKMTNHNAPLCVGTYDLFLRRQLKNRMNRLKAD